VTGRSADVGLEKIIGTYNDYAGRPLTVLQDVYKSESDSNQRNQAIGALMLAYGYIKSNWPQAVRSLYATVFSRRQREGPGDDGGDAGCRREESSLRQAPAR
jgi:Glutaminase